MILRPHFVIAYHVLLAVLSIVLIAFMEGFGSEIFAAAFFINLLYLIVLPVNYILFLGVQKLPRSARYSLPDDLVYDECFLSFFAKLLDHSRSGQRDICRGNYFYLAVLPRSCADIGELLARNFNSKSSVQHETIVTVASFAKSAGKNPAKQEIKSVRICVIRGNKASLEKTAHATDTNLHSHTLPPKLAQHATDRKRPVL